MTQKPDTVSEEAAAPEQVDWPVQETVITLPAEQTEAPGIDTSSDFAWIQEFPGDDQGPPPQSLPLVSANRVTEVSDIILFGSALIAANDPPFILIPAHRNRLRVTLQIDSVDEGSVSVYLGNTPDVVPGFAAWHMVTTDPLVFATRDVIYVAAGASGESVSIQWATELVSE